MRRGSKGRALRSGFAALALIFSAESQAEPGELSWSGRFRLISQAFTRQSDSPFALPESLAPYRAQSLEEELQGRLGWRGFHLDGSLRARQQTGSPGVLLKSLSEAYYEKNIWSMHLAAGKKLQSWGVGEAFRPLDRLQFEDRRAWTETQTGVPSWSVSWASETQSVEWVHANPLAGAGQSPKESQSVALRLYQRLEATDLLGLARVSREAGIEAGAGASATLSEALGIYGSFLYQDRWQSPGAAGERRGALLANLGLNAAFSNGLTGTTEAWVDGTAGSAADWRELLRSSRTFLVRPSLLRENVYARLAWKWESFEPALDWLWAPSDGGWIGGARMTYSWERHRIEFGFSRNGGPEDALYPALPDLQQAYLLWAVHF